MSPSGLSFAWLTSLPPNSILYWADLENQFHQFFYFGVYENKLLDLASLMQRNDESIASHIKRFRETKNWCYSLALSYFYLTILAYQILLLLTPFLDTCRDQRQKRTEVA